MQDEASGASQALTRRTFLATTSAALAAAAAKGAVNDEPSPASRGDTARAAIAGGEKAVKSLPVPGIRWGLPERERLDAMIEQDTLFYWQGPQTKAFIQRFQKICPLDHVMTCSSGTAALHIAAAAAGIGPGDEVITSPITDMGTVIGVIFQQGVPVFADLGGGTYNLALTDVERKITPRTKAIIAVHLAGNPCDTTALRALADRHNLVLIEDCAQAWGARHRGRPIGTGGHIACFSLQNSKHITCGDGGVVASSDPRYGPLLQKFGDKGFDRLKPGLFESLATNYRMSEPQAAVAAAQLDRLEAIVERRSRLGTALTRELAGTRSLILHEVEAADRCSFWFYMLRVRPEAFRCDRGEFVKALSAEGIPASAGYIPVPLYGNPVFQRHAFFGGRWPVREAGLTRMDYSVVKCPEAEAILRTGIRIQLHEAMEEPHVREIATGVRKVVRHYLA
jgi:dTDP-4-amino-4,6-dideoxygalactose transaminase